MLEPQVKKHLYKGEAGLTFQLEDPLLELKNYNSARK